MSLLKERTKHNRIAWKRLNAYGSSSLYEGHVPGSEFWIEFDMYSQNRLQIVPKFNLINNVGLREDSEHSKSKYSSRKLKSVFNMETFELSFPLKHPQYVIPDINYEKQRNKLLDYNTPVLTSFFKRACRVIKILFTNPKYFFQLLSTKMHKTKEYEK